MFTAMEMMNFKSWVATGSVALAPLTVFFGANSSGKSSLLQMLLLLKQTAESSDRGLVLKTGSLHGGDYVNLGTVNEITHGDADSLSLSISWNLPGSLDIPLPVSERNDADQISISDMTFSTRIRASVKEISVEQFDYTSDQFHAGINKANNSRYELSVRVVDTSPDRLRGRPRHIASAPYKCYGFPDEALRLYSNTEYLNDLVLELESQFQRLHYLGPLRERPERIYTWAGEQPSNVGAKGELAIPALLAGGNKRAYPNQRGKGAKQTLERRIAELLVEMGLAHSFRAYPIVEGGIQYEVRLKRHRNSPEVLITDMGFGVSQVLPVLVLCYYVPEGSTIIFEQPELHLHPAVQSALADVFIDVITRRRVQLIVESHSEHLLRRLQLRIAQETLSKDDVALYFCQLEEDRSRLERLNVDIFGHINNWPQDFFGDLVGDVINTFDSGLRRQIG